MSDLLRKILFILIKRLHRNRVCVNTVNSCKLFSCYAMLSQSVVTRLVVFLCFTLAMPSALLAQDDEAIRFGILSIAPPSRIYSKWQPFADYMSKQLGRPVELVVPRGFGKMKKTIADGKVDFFYVNSHVFYRLKQEGKATGIAQMQNIAGRTMSSSDIFVTRGSGINSVEDLRNKSIAFVSPMGAGGYLAPRATLVEKGLDPEKDATEVFTKNLSNSIHGVLLGDYDAATMCGVNYALMTKKINSGELKIIASSDAYPENVIGANPAVDPALREAFQTAVLSMNQDAEGKKLLQQMQSMKIKNFLPYDESVEKVTQRLLEKSHLQ